MKKTIVVALGGNALGDTPDEQKQLVIETAKLIVQLVKEENRVVVTHGNGPQVGMIQKAFNIATTEDKTVPDMPFPECGAMSQGYIGYHIQNAIQNELIKNNMSKHACALITQVEVSEDDPAFLNPTKPIGSFYSEDEAKELSEVKGYQMMEDAGRGFRQVVPSPMPINVLEKEMIKELIATDSIVIACGGGGIPVVRKGCELFGVAAVIDKDFAAEKLAELVNADQLLILTAVDHVAINFGKKNQSNLGKVSYQEVEKHLSDGQFAPGSMLPKVQAALKFVKFDETKVATVTSIDKAYDAYLEKSGTIISKKG